MYYMSIDFVLYCKVDFMLRFLFGVCFGRLH
jgi:hypothetical protein